MNVSAINCTPIKPQVSFGNEQENYERALYIAKDLTDEYVRADDIKNPFQVMLSITAAAGKSFLQGASTFLGLDLISKGAVSNGIKKAGKKVVNSLERAAVKIGDSSAVKKGVSNALASAGKTIKNIGANSKIPILAGIASAIAIVPAICSRDNDGDGVKDIVQKSQSAYDKFENDSSKMLHGVSQVAELVSLLS